MPVIVSSTNEGPVVNIAAWFGITVMVLGVGARIFSKYSVIKKWTIDDIAIVIPTVSLNRLPHRSSADIHGKVLASAMTATISQMVANGLGQPQQSLSDRQLSDFQKVLRDPDRLSSH